MLDPHGKATVAGGIVRLRESKTKTATIGHLSVHLSGMLKTALSAGVRRNREWLAGEFVDPDRHSKREQFRDRPAAVQAEQKYRVELK